MNIFLDYAMCILTNSYTFPVAIVTLEFRYPSNDRFVGLCNGKSSFQRASTILADEVVHSDLASRNRRDRWHYHYFHALFCEPTAPSLRKLWLSTNYHLHLQLKTGRSEGTSLSTKNATSKIVRLTIETNLLTSKRILNSGTLPCLTAIFQLLWQL